MFVVELDHAVSRDQSHPLAAGRPSDGLNLLHAVHGRTYILGVFELHLNFYRFEFEIS